MSNSSQSAVPIRNRPTPVGEKCVWEFPHEFHENEGLATLGFLQSILNQEKIKQCTIDLKFVEWADPQPLLCLGMVLAESKLNKNQVIINLGSTNEKYSTQRHRIFLKFLALQGFLFAFGDHALFRCEGVIQQDLQQLRLHLVKEPEPIHFLNADCIFARIMPVEHLSTDKTLLQEGVEILLKEAKECAARSAFGSEPLARDMLFQKLRKLLYELLLNIAEHSHQKGVPSYAGIYARIRGPKPFIEKAGDPWTNLFQKTINTFGQRNFAPNQYAEWLELFICDIGVGLTTHIADWKEPANKKVASDLRKAQKAKNPLEAIAYRLFRSPLSRHPRHDVTRTAVTGLQHLGHILAIGGDYCRLYTQDGCWIGDHFPWSKDGHYSRKDIRTPNPNPKPDMKYDGLKPVSGTAYVFSIQPNHHNLTNDQAALAYPNENGRQAIIKALRSRTCFHSPAAVEWCDRSAQNSCFLPKVDELFVSSPEVMVLRPPRLMGKHDIADWLNYVTENAPGKNKNPVNIFVLADLTPFQALAFRELLLNVIVSKKSQLDVYLISENWAASCVTTLIDSEKFSPSASKALDFINSSGQDQIFSAAGLAVLLREMDSQIFWKSTTDNIRAPFFANPVLWFTSKNKNQPISLDRYLDFPLALVNPKSYRACRRALGRCLALYPEHQAIGADDLVASLVRDATLASYTPREKITSLFIIVGSIAVTAGTVNRAKDGSDSDSIQMMIHSDAEDTSDPKSLAAMLWISQLRNFEKLIPTEKENANFQPWRRIPNTSYIAPLGEQSISILRYQRRPDESLDFEKPLYGRTPEDTYNDFQRLGILKNGHWKYGSRHDLLTINMRLAFRFSFLELGPLYNWIKEQFTFLFSTKKKKKALAQLLIYPSHPVTDTMLDRIRQDQNFSDILPEGGMIPVKFLGMHTVSPLLASHLVAYRIEHLVKDWDWKAWSAVIFDDGTVSGKHLQELMQFLQGLGAKNTYTIALLDRTGLPAQENILKIFLETHKRLWRWDIPALGNKRDCPLCQGLAIAQTYAERLPSDRQKLRLNEWVKIWKVRDVDIEWHQGGLLPTPIIPPLKITFGVDEKQDGSRTEKHISLSNSTAATSILLELTRLTTRADTTLKKAKEIETTYPDAAIEMIASQLLLFLDELSMQEKRERFINLLTLLWTSPNTTQAMSLAGLCFTLADQEILEGIWNTCVSDFLQKQRIGNLDAILATNILRSRYAFVAKKPYQLAENANSIERENYIMLGGDGSLRQVVRNFLTALYRNPNIPDQICAHSTEIRKRLICLSEINDSTNIEILMKRVSVVIQDMRLVEQIMLNIKNEFIIREIDKKIIILNNIICRLEEKLKQRGNGSQINSEYIENVREISNQLLSLLYGQEEKKGLVDDTASQFLRHFKNSAEFDNNLIAKIVRIMGKEWTQTLHAKKTASQNEKAAKRWQGDNGQTIQPEILGSTNTAIEELWLYCDSFVQGVLEDTLANVFHATKQITDPFTTKNQDPTKDPKAHLWWRLEKKGDYAEFTTANASANKKIDLKQKVNIAGLEHAGGNISNTIKESNEKQLVAYTILRIPLHSAFIKEKS